MPVFVTEILRPNLRDLLDRVRTDAFSDRDADSITLALRLCHRTLYAAHSDLSLHDAQSTVDDWVLSALKSFLYGDLARVQALFERFDEAEWGDGVLSYVAPDPSLFSLLWEEDHIEGEHVDELDPNCIACPLDGYSHVILGTSVAE